mgnify:CR=1 FL=1
MNDLLDARWRSASPPFDGSVLSVPSAQLAEGRGSIALRAVVAQLKRECPDAELRSLDDWHEHDGYLTEDEPCSWHALETLLTSDEAIAAACSDDSYVLKLVYPTSLEFCLRFRPRFDDVQPALHVFASKATLHTIRTSLEAAGFNDLQLEPATPFLLRSYPE